MSYVHFKISEVAFCVFSFLFLMIYEHFVSLRWTVNFFAKT